MEDEKPGINLCMHESGKNWQRILEKRGWNTARFLLILKKIKKKRSFKRKMVLGITPNTKFVYSLIFTIENSKYMY